jgi:hypothetical protein
MVKVVESDADELANGANAGTEPWRASDKRQSRKVNSPQFGLGFREQDRARYVGNYGGEVAKSSIGINRSRVLIAGPSNSYEFHLFFLLLRVALHAAGNAHFPVLPGIVK